MLTILPKKIVKLDNMESSLKYMDGRPCPEIDTKKWKHYTEKETLCLEECEKVAFMSQKL